MLYYFLVPYAADWTALNVFRYLTFRSMAALITALLISILFGSRFINWLRRLKAGQYILEDVASHAAKAGTPTMGGLLIFASLLASSLLWGDLANVYFWETIFVFAGFGAVGLWDDLSKLRHHQNKGISAKSKMAAQIFVAALAMWALEADPGYTNQLYVPFFKEWVFDLGWWYAPLGVFIMVAASNAVNLTDGLDGLAIGPVIVACLVFAIFIYITGNSRFSQYLLVPYTPGVGEVTVFCAALVGAGLGFLWFNAYPAQVFMGDTGSLTLGGIIAVFALLIHKELLLPLLCAIFFVEDLSVMMQVAYFKYTKKKYGTGRRIFKMTPLHHHYQKPGNAGIDALIQNPIQPVPESKIVTRFWIIGLIFAVMTFVTLKIR